MKTKFFHLAGLLLSVVMLSGFASVAFPQSYPNKTVRLVVPFAPGGTSGGSATIIGHGLTERLGKQVLIDYQPGGSGITGTNMVAKAPPDGYTILMTSTSSHIINSCISVKRKLPYDVVKDFAAVILTSRHPLVLVVNPSVTVNSVKELITLAKSKKSQLNYGSGGVGSLTHLAAELFKFMAGIDMVHIPYKGGGPALTANISGEVPLQFTTLVTATSAIQAGSLKALAVSSSSRLTTFPNLPTISESVPGFEVTSWNGIVAPAGTPKEIVTRLNAEVSKVLFTPDVRETLIKLGADPTASTPEEFANIIKTDIAKYDKLIKDSGIVID